MASRHEFPDGTPDYVVAAFDDLEMRAQSLVRNSEVPPEVARGYFMAFCDLKDAFETEVAFEKAKVEEDQKRMLKAHQEAERLKNGEYS
jgi:hypothetical protein